MSNIGKQEHDLQGLESWKKHLENTLSDLKYGLLYEKSFSVRRAIQAAITYYEDQLLNFPKQ